MGACVSTHYQNQNQKQKQNQNQNPIFGSDLLQKPPIINPKPHSNTPGSKEETFFDSQAWLESDCDDDFISVNGEFTPSRGSTPVHHNFSAGNNKALVSPYNYPNTPSDDVKKPRLSDLFKESLRADNYDFEDEDKDKDKDGEKQSKRLGCFRSLVPSRSSSTNGRKMMMMSPPNPKPVVG